MLVSILMHWASNYGEWFTIVSTAVIIKCFYDDRIPFTRGRVLLSFVASVVHFLLQIAYEILKLPILSALFEAWPLLVISSLMFIVRRGMPKRYYVESFLLFIAVLNVCYVCSDELSGLMLRLSELISPAAYQRYVANAAKHLMFKRLIMLPEGIILCLWCYFMFIRKRIFLKMRKRDTVLFLVYFIFVNYCYFTASASINTLLPKAIGVSQLVFDIFLIILIPFYMIMDRQTSYFSEMSTRNEQFLEAELIASNVYRQSQQDTRAFRHDMNNNLAIVSSLMKKGSYEQAEQYVDELHGRLASFSPRIVTGEDMLDALISSKLADIEQRGITFTVSGVIDGGLGWKPIDVCAVFANLIDNAAEACDKIEQGEKYIRLSFRKTEHQVIITLQNSVAARVDCSRLLDGSYYTSKADRSHHGFGMKNIKETLEKNGAIMQLTCSDTEFMTTMILMRTGVGI